MHLKKHLRTTACGNSLSDDPAIDLIGQKGIKNKTVAETKQTLKLNNQKSKIDHRKTNSKPYTVPRTNNNNRIHPQHQHQLHPNLEHFAALASQTSKQPHPPNYSQTVQGIYGSCPSQQVLTSLQPPTHLNQNLHVFGHSSLQSHHTLQPVEVQHNDSTTNQQQQQQHQQQQPSLNLVNDLFVQLTQGSFNHSK